MVNFLKKNYLILILLTLSLTSHWYVFFDKGTLVAPDWEYHFSTQVAEFNQIFLYTPYINLGALSAIPAKSIFMQLYFLLNLIGFSTDMATRMIFLVPIIIFTPIFSYLCFRQLLKNELMAFFAAALYCFNTSFLKTHLDYLMWAYVWWLLPALIISLLKFLETRRKKYLLLNSFLVFLTISFELRLSLIVLIFCGVFVFFEVLDLKNNLIQKVKVFFILILSLGMGSIGHFYWIVPLAFANISTSFSALASPTPFVSLYTLRDAISLRTYHWSNNFVFEYFIKQSYERRFYLVPIIVFVGLISLKSKQVLSRYRTSFFLLLTVVLLFLGKQELTPFPEVYGWLFSHIPLFNLLRESSKFFILIAFCLSLFFGIGLFWIYEKLNKNSRPLALIVVTFLLFITTFYNLEHFFDQRVGGMTKGKEIPKEYIRLEEILSQDKVFYRILWMPTFPEFGYSSNTHPAIYATDLTTIYKDRVNFVLFDKTDVIQNQLSYLLNQTYSAELLNKASVRYVIVPSIQTRELRSNVSKKETVQMYFESYGPREAFVSFLNNVPYLKKVNLPGVANLDIYENMSYLPHIYLSNSMGVKNIEFRMVNPTEYKLRLSEAVLSKLNFSESYSIGWELIDSKCNWAALLVNRAKCVYSVQHQKDEFNLNVYSFNHEDLPNEVSLYYLPQTYSNLGFVVSIIVITGYGMFLFYKKGYSMKKSL